VQVRVAYSFARNLSIFLGRMNYRALPLRAQSSA